MIRLPLLLIVLLGFCSGLNAAERNTEVKLLLSHSQARPGETITAALQMVSQPGWHAYWENPGDAGLPASAEWQLPAGLIAGDIQFPVPEKLIIATLFAYVYEGEVLLLVPMTVPASAPNGSHSLNGTISWLECSEKTCLPQDAPVTATLVIGKESTPSPHAELIAKWRDRLPREQTPFTVSATWESLIDTNSRPIMIEWSPNAPVQKPDFFPFPSENFSVQGTTEILEASSNQVRIRKTVQLHEGNWPQVIAGLVLNETGKDKHVAYAVQLRPEGGSIGSAAATAIQLGGDGTKRSLLAILGLALLGGLILNVMPCVLPVIALKILGFVNQSREEPGRVRQLGIVYMLGVLASFLVLAGVIISVKNATGAANWGFQMQNPYFVVGMTALVTLVALNLFGVFEITLASSALGTASGLASREGASGAFYNGILATLLATPCTAPALGAAIGAVITQPSRIIVLTFLTVGLGLALPYVLLSWNPRWLKFLPKPGPWMEKFKMSMGFPMLATAIWLLSVASNHFGKSGFLWLGLFLVCLSLAAWIWGDFVQRGAKHRTFAMALAAVILLGGYAYALEGKLHWREPRLAQNNSNDLALEPGGIPWRKWSAAAVAEARAAGHPVLVDFTADWCLTCQVNKTTSLEIDSVVQKLQQIDAVPFLADFTVSNPEISQELRRYNRAGVPLVIVFPADPNAAPILLPELLTPGVVLEALDLAANKITPRLSATR
jgi:thiol:disulfide interchange protein